MERATIEVYERNADRWAAVRPPRHRDRAAALAARALPGRLRLDAGCGPGGYLADLAAGADAPVVALDGALAMVELARATCPGALGLRADLEALPFRDRSLGAAWARNTYVHVARTALPLALARLQWALAPGAPAELSFLAGDGEGPWPADDFPGRFFCRWQAAPLADVLTGAGFAVEALEAVDDVLWCRLARARTLPDTVGPGMRVLCCGLNPSVVAADAGVGYAGPTNRFWPAAVAAGLAPRARDPLGALAVGTGMTDLVKRATPNAAALAPGEYRAGAERVRRMVEWLGPGVVLFVGLSGWRAAVDAKAVAGPQPDGFAGRPAYVMPSTSGLNAHARPADLVEHMRRAVALGKGS